MDMIDILDYQNKIKNQKKLKTINSQFKTHETNKIKSK